MPATGQHSLSRPRERRKVSGSAREDRQEGRSQASHSFVRPASGQAEIASVRCRRLERARRRGAPDARRRNGEARSLTGSGATAPAPGGRDDGCRTEADTREGPFRLQQDTRGCGIAVMAKASAPGRTKTRLVPPLTYDEAAAFNTAFLQDIAANLLKAGQAADITGTMAFGPPGSEAFFHRHLPPGIGLIEVWFPNFGECLFVAIQELLRRDHAAAVVSQRRQPDLADRPAGADRRAAGAAGRPRGARSRQRRRLLSARTEGRPPADCSRTSTGAPSGSRSRPWRARREIGLPMHVLPTWYDVDDLAALRTLLAEIRTGHSFDARLAPNQPVHTAALLDTLLRADRPGGAPRHAGRRLSKGSRCEPAAGLKAGLIALGAALLALSAVGAVALWREDHVTVWIVALLQVPRLRTRRLAGGHAAARRPCAAGPRRCRHPAGRPADAAAAAPVAAGLHRPVALHLGRAGPGRRHQPVSARPERRRAAAPARRDGVQPDQPRRLRADDLPAHRADRVLPRHAGSARARSS